MTPAVFKKLNYVVNYEISIANSFWIALNKIKLREYKNELIVVSQVLSENFNISFYKTIFFKMI